MQALQYDPDKADSIIPGGDHAIDALRYFFLWKHGPNQPIRTKAHPSSITDIARYNH